MNNLNLIKIGVQELEDKDLVEIEGGFWGAVAGGLVLYGIISAIEYPQDFVDGLLGR